MKIEEIRKYFEECHDKSDGNDCDECGENNEDERLWYERTSHEYDEGNYYCDECAIKRIRANT